MSAYLTVDCQSRASSYFVYFILIIGKYKNKIKSKIDHSKHRFCTLNPLNMAYWKYIIIICMAIISFIGFSFAILLFYRIIKNLKRKKIKCVVLWLTNISIICCSLCIISDSFHLIKSFITGKDIISNDFILIMVISDILLFIGDISFYIVLIFRVISAFKDSYYALNKCLIYLLYFLIFIAISLCGLYIFILLTSYKEMSEFLIHSKYIATTFILIEGIMDIVLSTIFIYKLCQLILSLDIDINNNDKTTSTQIINLITRHLILFGTAIIANFIMLFVYILLTFVFQNEYTLIIVYICRTIENLTIIIALFLNLNINHSIYNKLCNCCHTICLKICVTKPYKRQVSMHSSYIRNNN